MTKDQITNFKKRESRLQVCTQQKYHNFSFKQNQTYNLNNKETAHASPSGRLPSHTKGKLGGHSKALNTQTSPIFPFCVCSLYGRFESVLKLQHSQQRPAPHIPLTFTSSETAVRDLKLLMQLSALPAVIPILQNKKQDRKTGRLWPNQSLKQFTTRVGEYLKISTWRDIHRTI